MLNDWVKAYDSKFGDFSEFDPDRPESCNQMFSSTQRIAESAFKASEFTIGLTVRFGEFALDFNIETQRHWLSPLEFVADEDKDDTIWLGHPGEEIDNASWLYMRLVPLPAAGGAEWSIVFDIMPSQRDPMGTEKMLETLAEKLVNDPYGDLSESE